MADKIAPPNSSAYEMGRGIGDTLRGPSLSSNEQYNEFLDETETFNSSFNRDAVKERSYYALMSPEQRKNFKVVVDVSNAANAKKNPTIGPPTLDTFAKTPELVGNSFSTLENERLDTIPGVHESLILYVRFFDSDTVLGSRTTLEGKREDYTFRTAYSGHEIGVCRNKVREIIEPKIRSRYEAKGVILDNESLKLMAREAEQAAFAYANVGLLFESLDGQADDNHVIRPARCLNDCVSGALKAAMKPMDAMLGNFNKPKSDFKQNARFDKWAYEQATIANGGRIPRFEKILLIDPEDEGNYWKISSDKKSISVPKVYPQLVKSVFEETKIGNRDLLSYIRAGESIPWEHVPTNMWQNYTSLLKSASFINDVLAGAVDTSWGDQIKYTKWANDINDKLAKFSFGDENKLKRILIYSTMGVKPNKKTLRLLNQDKRGTVQGAFGPNRTGFISDGNILFPGDARRFYE